MAAIPRVLGSLSTTHRGTAFEERSRRILQDHMSMSLRRVGGKSDGGIDLLGWWWLPPLGLPACSSMAPRRRIRVVGQCKAEKKKMGPKYVRELEGVLHRYHMSPPHAFAPQDASLHAPALTSSSHHQPIVGLLVSESPFTKSTVLRALSSPIPFFLLHLPPLTSRRGDFHSDSDVDIDEDDSNTAWTGTAVWNRALGGETGLLGGEFETRWERSLAGTGASRPGLWWQNQKLVSWAPDDGVEGV